MSLESLVDGQAKKLPPSLYYPFASFCHRYLDLNTIRLKKRLHYEIKKLERINNRLTFVQVGSNDGLVNDPFHQWVLRGTCEAHFFEPVPDVFARLVKNYRSKAQKKDFARFKFNQKAVTSQEIDLNFYSISPRAKEELGKRIPHWWHQLSSFNRDHIAKYFDGQLVPYIEELKVETTTLSRYAKDNSLSKIDVLHIDAEGHDWQVLQSLKFEELRPALILVEHRHLVPADKTAMLRCLANAGYAMTEFRTDLLAVLACPEAPSKSTSALS